MHVHFDFERASTDRRDASNFETFACAIGKVAL